MQDLLSPVRVHHPPCVDVFTNPEALRVSCYWRFMEVPSCEHDQLLTPIFSPSLLSREVE